MQAKTKYSGNFLNDLLKINNFDELDYDLINQDAIFYTPKNIGNLSSFLSMHNDKTVCVTDCDADGLSSAGVIKSYFPDMPIYIGSRGSDRGLSEELYHTIQYEHSPYGILTTDCSASYMAGYLASQYGIDIFVTDHHVPDYDISFVDIINPHLDGWGDYLSGSSLIYICLQHLFGPNDSALQYAAIGAICDVVPLIYENRYIVKRGIELLNSNPDPKIKNLLDGLKINSITEKSIAWYLGPAINAASRLDRTDIAYDAYVVGKSSKIPELNDLNQERKKITKKAAKEAAVYTFNNFVIGYVKKTEAAIAGLVAMELTKRYGKPACVCVDVGDNYACSIRTLDTFDATEFIKNIPMIDGGGHAAAAGFSVKPEDFASFVVSAGEYTDKIKLQKKMYVPDLQVSMGDLENIYTEMQKYKPYGRGFECPTFLLKNVQIDKVWRTTNNHIGANVGDYVAYYYNPPEDVNTGYVDLAFELEYNIWKKQLQIIILDLEQQYE